MYQDNLVAWYERSDAEGETTEDTVSGRRPTGRVVVVAAVAIALWACGCSDPLPITPRGEPVMQGEVHVLPRTPYLAEYSCMDECHAKRDPNPQKRKLVKFHTDRKIDHGRGNAWCTDCHQPSNYDRLRLSDGTSVSFDEAYRVCGQCHATKLRDWQKGIHGLETGSWVRGSERRSCPVCHDPHNPKRPKFQALPAPAPPREPWPWGHLSAAARRARSGGEHGGHDGHP